MDLSDWFEGEALFIPPLEALLRLGMAALFGSVIGIDREARNKPAGLRTHMLTALAAALYMLLALELHHELTSGGNGADTDPIRIIEAVTAGVAFLAAGVIIQARGSVQGLTTGASMWLSAALGVASGGGYYQLATMGTALGVIILTALAWVERRWGKDDTESEPSGR